MPTRRDHDRPAPPRRDGERGPGEPPRAELRADCARCFALCCVAPAFAASADFAVDKGAGDACPNLRADLRCGIHDALWSRGFRGCSVYDCFGAGQRVSERTFGGQDWRQAPAIAEAMFDVFSIVRHLHELLWYLAEAIELAPPSALRDELHAAADAIERLASDGPGALRALDVDAHRRDVNALLVRTSELARAGVRPKKDRRGADLAGADLRGADLRGASLRGALLIHADLRSADLRLADFTGADLRGADLRGADLTGSIFLTPSQLAAAKGDAGTRLSPPLAPPEHWSHASAPALVSLGPRRRTGRRT